MKNKKILIIGGTGALGKALLDKYKDENELFVMSRKEHTQEAFKRYYPDIKFKIGNVEYKDSIRRTLLEFKPQVIINTAALKTVAVCQDNPFESISINILGHQNIIDCVSELSVPGFCLETLVFVSTDKACNPINVYGMSKSIAEQLYVNFSKVQSDIKCVLVRYGNVLNSTGSIIPVFKKMIDNGRKVLPITDPDMTRFLITLEDSTELIDWAISHPESHGKITVPKLKALNLLDIAEQISKACGIIEMKYNVIGAFDGEKVHEEMISIHEWPRTIDRGKYFLIGSERVSKNNELHSYNSKDCIAEGEDRNRLCELIRKFTETSNEFNMKEF